jgi:kynurenine formamidase
MQIRQSPRDLLSTLSVAGVASGRRSLLKVMWPSEQQGRASAALSGRNVTKRIAGYAFVVLAAALLTGTETWAQANEPACPWEQDDPTDEIGASKTQTPEKALQAIKLVKTGQVFGLAHIYDEETIPLPFGREFDVTIVPFDPEERPSQTFHTHGQVTASLDQVGTQFDALGHAGHDTLGFYNCIPQEELGPDELGRLRKLGIESVSPFFTRGILLDFVNHSSAPKMEVNGQTMLVDSYVITLDDVEEVLRSQGVAKPREGEVVLFYTGWDSLFGVDNDRFFDSPGPGIGVADWLASRKVALVGADTMAVEALDGGISPELVDSPDLFGDEIGAVFNAVHFILLTENGIHLLELMRLQLLAQALLDAFHGERDPSGRGFRQGHGSPYEFLFTYAPVPIKGLSGSPGQPLAVR